mmetsp:Transcript_6985/g.21740  ORF Transcript_6985/g.21740 Transcript_6985/m.21740 type:complete len:221 (+) Transcript_6985:894-1556(+)
MFPAPGTKVYSLNVAVFHAPFASISFVKSCSNFFLSNANSGPRFTAYSFHVSTFANFLFFINASNSFAGTSSFFPSLIILKYVRHVSVISSTFATTEFVALSIANHFCCIACLNPTSDIVFSSFLNSGKETPFLPLLFTKSNALASGLPFSIKLIASSVKFSVFLSVSEKTTTFDAAKDLMMPTMRFGSTSCCEANDAESTSPSLCVCNSKRFSNSRSST